MSIKVKRGVYKLHEHGRHGERVLMFLDKRERGRYLALKKNEAYKRKLQFTFRRNEYLRVYENSILFYELDIATKKENKNVRPISQDHPLTHLEREAQAWQLKARAA